MTAGVAVRQKPPEWQKSREQDNRLRTERKNDYQGEDQHQAGHAGPDGGQQSEPQTGGHQQHAGEVSGATAPSPNANGAAKSSAAAAPAASVRTKFLAVPCIIASVSFAQMRKTIRASVEDVGQQRHETGALDGACQFTLLLCRDSRDTARHDLAAFRKMYRLSNFVSL